MHSDMDVGLPWARSILLAGIAGKEAVLELVLPPTCRLCDLPVGGSDDFCRRCETAPYAQRADDAGRLHTLWNPASACRQSTSPGQFRGASRNRPIPANIWMRSIPNRCDLNPAFIAKVPPLNSMVWPRSGPTRIAFARRSWQPNMLTRLRSGMPWDVDWAAVLRRYLREICLIW